MAQSDSIKLVVRLAELHVSISYMAINTLLCYVNCTELQLAQQVR
jgi:hypothetical protein